MDLSTPWRSIRGMVAADWYHCAARLGAVLPYRQCLGGVQRGRQERRVAGAAPINPTAGGSLDVRASIDDILIVQLGCKSVSVLVSRSGPDWLELKRHECDDLVNCHRCRTQEKKRKKL
jgi:hypothetical protein